MGAAGVEVPVAVSQASEALSANTISTGMSNVPTVSSASQSYT